MEKIAIVGNGPSRDLYAGFDGAVCVCNIPQLMIDYDYISIVDRKAIDHIHAHSLRFDRPILTTPDLAAVCRTTRAEPAFERKLMTSATTAAYYFAHRAKAVWLYGCDSLWSERTDSHQDEIIHRAPRARDLYLRWRTHWQEVWGTNCEFHIVYPGGEHPHYGDNVHWHAK